MIPVLSILLILFALPALAGDNIIGHIGSGVWTKTTPAANNNVLTWSSGSVAGTGWTDPYSNKLAILWRMDPTATNSSGYVLDASPAANHGTFQGGMTAAKWTITGTNAVSGSPNLNRVEHAYSTPQADTDYIVGINTLTLSSRTNQRTMMIWFKAQTNNFTSDCGIIGLNAKTANNDGAIFAVWVDDADDHYHLSAYGANIDSGFPVSNEWQHISAVLDTSVKAYLYVNGKTTAVNGFQITAANENYGAPQCGKAVGYIGGMMDDFRIYTNTTLTQAQCAAVYNNTLKPDASDENGY